MMNEKELMGEVELVRAWALLLRQALRGLPDTPRAGDARRAADSLVRHTARLYVLAHDTKEE